MINKLTSINSLLSKVVRDLGLGDNEVPWQDMIEWVAEGLEHIGCYYQFQEKEGVIIIEDHKGLLPCDFHKSIRFLQGCSMNGLYNAGPLWSQVGHALDRCGLRDTNSKNPCVIDALSFQKLQLAQYSKVFNTGSFYNGLQYSQSLMDKGITYTPSGSSDYAINLDTVTASFRYGYIKLRYLAFPVDENGYPLVPDNVSFRDALMWKCAYQLSLRGYTFKQEQLNDPEYCKFYWNQYCVQARANGTVPDPDMMERIARIFNTLSVNYHQYSQDFRNLGISQNINLNGRF